MALHTDRTGSDSDDSDDDSPETIVLCPGAFRADDDLVQLCSEEYSSTTGNAAAASTLSPPPKTTADEHELMPSPITPQAPSHFVIPQVPPSPPPTTVHMPPSPPPPGHAADTEAEEDPVTFFQNKLLSKTGDTGLQQNCILEFEQYVISLGHCAEQGIFPSFETHKMWCKEFNANWGPAGNGVARFINAKRMGDFLHNYLGFEWNEHVDIEMQHGHQQPEVRLLSGVANAPKSEGGYTFRQEGDQIIMLPPQQGGMADRQPYSSPPIWSPENRAAPVPFANQRGYGKQGRQQGRKNHVNGWGKPPMGWGARPRTLAIP